MRAIGIALALVAPLAVGCNVGGNDTTVVEAAPAVETGEPREQVENPQYTSWAKFPPGTVAVHKTVIRGDGSDAATVMTTTYTLLEITPERAVVQMQVSTKRYDGFEANDRPEKFTHPKMLVLPPGMKKDRAGKPTGVIDDGEESITVAGKEYRAKWYKGKDRNEGGEMFTQVWSSPEVPGGLLKSVTRTPAIGKSTTIELVEIAAEEVDAVVGPPAEVCADHGR